MTAATLCVLEPRLATSQPFNAPMQTWVVTTQTHWQNVMLCLAVGGSDVPVTACDAFTGYDRNLPHTIAFSNDITISSSDIYAINLVPPAGPLTIEGNGHALDGAGFFRGIFVWKGTVTIQNLTIRNCRAKGGDGGSGNPSGSGGAGLGGGLFIAPGAIVTVSGVNFTNDQAAGGNVGTYLSGSYGDAGGMGGRGGSATVVSGLLAGGGGIGGTAVGGSEANLGFGGSGIVPGAARGGSSTDPGGTYGGGGGAGNAMAITGAGGGIAGGSPSIGYGGFGGGAADLGGGGFGGGGSTISSAPAGFGGGGIHAGFGGGSDIDTGNGGGLGAGGSVFVTEGASLTIGTGSWTGGSVAGGSGSSPPGNGLGLGSGLFIQGNTSVTFSPSAGNFLTIDDVIADQTGSGGSGSYPSGGPNCNPACGGYSGAASGSIVVNGPGVVLLYASNTYTGTTTVNGGALVVNGSISNSATTVKNLATAKGTGSYGSVTVQNGGTLAPGLSPGILSTKNLLLEGGAKLNIELNGTSVGTGYDQVTVTGGVTVTGATLLLIVNFTPSVGDSFRIIDNDGVDPVVGTFVGLPEGGTLTTGNSVFTISYVGGTGNDVVVTLTGCVNDAAAPAVTAPAAATVTQTICN